MGIRYSDYDLVFLNEQAAGEGIQRRQPEAVVRKSEVVRGTPNLPTKIIPAKIA